MALQQVHCMGALLDLLAVLRVQRYLNATLRTYKNNVIPVVPSTTPAFIESDFVGYNPQPMNAWAMPVDNLAEGAQMDHPQLAFSCTGGAAQPIFGVFVTIGVQLVYAQRLDPADVAVPFNIGPGMQFLYTARVILKNLPAGALVAAGEAEIRA